MRVAVCSLSEFTHAAEFVDAAERLGERHEVRQYLGWERPAATGLLRRRGISHEVLLAGSDAVPELPPAAAAGSAHALFEDYFIAHAERVLPRLTSRLASYAPDVVVSHLRDYAGITAAERAGIPVVSIGSHASPHRVEPLDPPFGAGLAADAPRAHVVLAWRLRRWFDARLDPIYNARLRRPHGLPDVHGASTLHSGRLVLLSLIPALSAKRSPEPDHVRYVGRLFTRRAGTGGDEERGHLEAIAACARPRVFVALGTTYASRLLDRCLEALAGFDGTLVVASGDPARTLRLAGAGRIVATAFGDVDAVVELCDAVVTVSAGKTVLESLSHGRPLVCLPQQGEQKEIALGLVRHGAGELPCPRRWDPVAVRAATRRVCDESRFAAAARRLGDDVERCGGAEAAVEAIERLYSP